MTGLWLEDGNLTLRHDLPVPVPGPGEALVRVELAGICGTDHELLAGYAGFRGVPGHELVGTVLSGPEGIEGRRVVADINVGCGDCPRCADAGRGHCPRRSVVGIRGRDGAFAELLALPAANLHPVPASVPDERAVLAEPLAAALRVQEQLAGLGPRTVLVVGAGRLGQLVARVMASTGAAVSVHGGHPRKLELLRRFGVRPVEGAGPPVGTFDAVVECTGSPGGFESARAAVRPRGVLVLKSTQARAATAIDLTALVVDEITVLGSRCGPLDRAAELLVGARLRLEELIDGRYPLTRAADAFAHSARRETLKVLLDPRE